MRWVPLSSWYHIHIQLVFIPPCLINGVASVSFPNTATTGGSIMERCNVLSQWSYHSNQPSLAMYVQAGNSFCCKDSFAGLDMFHTSINSLIHLKPVHSVSCSPKTRLSSFIWWLNGTFCSNFGITKSWLLNTNTSCSSRTSIYRCTLDLGKWPTLADNWT